MQSAEHHGNFQIHSSNVLKNCVLRLHSEQRHVTNIGTDDLFKEIYLNTCGLKKGIGDAVTVLCFVSVSNQIFLKVSVIIIFDIFSDHLLVLLKVLKYFCIISDGKCFIVIF